MENDRRDCIAWVTALVCVCWLTVWAGCADRASHDGDAGTGQSSGGGGPTYNGCADGELGCPCTLAGTCHPSSEAGQRLACLDGYCAPVDCPRGAQGCACYANGTCDALNDVPMTCNGNVCEESQQVEPGAIGGRCSASSACTDETAVCQDGLCQDPTCPLGELGCACGPFAACAGFAGRPARCDGGTCSIGSCEPGSPGCTCDGTTCETGYVCLRDLCLADLRLALRVDNPDVRSCNILLREGESRIAAVVYGEQARGEDVHRPPELAIAVMAAGDFSLAGEIARFDVPVGEDGESGVTLVESTCFTRLGRLVDEPLISLE